LPYLVPKSVSELEIQLEKNEEEQSKRIKFLEQRLLDNGLSINKQLANMQEDMRNQAIEILQLQDRKGIKPKALKDTRP
jgi:hypothetical protein